MHATDDHPSASRGDAERLVQAFSPSGLAGGRSRAVLIDIRSDYLDDATGQPTWVTVSTGLFGTRESFAPL